MTDALKQAAQAALDAFYAWDAYRAPLTDVGAAMNNLKAALAKPTPTQGEPVAWHHPDCEGACLACLIERVVHDEFGNTGTNKLAAIVAAAPAPGESHE